MSVKQPIPALTSIRFFLISLIVLGHFVQCGTKDPFILSLLKQHNMIVGAFFALSGYLLTYAYSEFHSSQIRSMAPIEFTLNRMGRIYPTYLASILFFLPLYIFVDLYYHYGWETLSHALCVITLTQSWIPSWGTLWNSPTWFLSACVFAYLIFPLILPKLTAVSRKTLWKLFFLTTIFHTIINTIYSTQSHFIQLEGMLPDNDWFNFFRFFPVFNALDIFLGMITARLYMTRAQPIESKTAQNLPFIILLGLISIIFIRTYFPLNDLVTRSAIFLPLWCAFMFYLTPNQGKLAHFLALKPLIFLGDISFSIYLIHSPIGQIFYKKAVAQYLWDSPPPFFIYCLTVFILSIVTYYYIEIPGQKWFKKLLPQSKTTKKT